jgi:hypothetical protein
MEIDTQREIHIVLDNPSFEFTMGLAFATYSLAANYAQKIVIYGKALVCR